MEKFEQAESVSNGDNDDAILRWNSCARIIATHNLQLNSSEDYVAYGD